MKRTKTPAAMRDDTGIVFASAFPGLDALAGDMTRYHRSVARREQIARRYDQAFAGLPVATPPRPAGGDLHAWHLYALRLCDAAAVSRDEFIERLFALGIGCSVHYIPLHLQPYWRDRYQLDAAQFPHSQRAYEQMLSLPIYTRMTDEDLERVVAALRRILVG